MLSRGAKGIVVGERMEGYAYTDAADKKACTEELVPVPLMIAMLGLVMSPASTGTDGTD